MEKGPSTLIQAPRVGDCGWLCDVRACMYSTLFRFMAYVSCHDGASYHCMKKLKYVHARMHACMHVYAGRDVMHGYHNSSTYIYKLSIY